MSDVITNPEFRVDTRPVRIRKTLPPDIQQKLDKHTSPENMKPFDYFIVIGADGTASFQDPDLANRLEQAAYSDSYEEVMNMVPTEAQVINNLRNEPTITALLQGLNVNIDGGMSWQILHILHENDPILGILSERYRRICATLIECGNSVWNADGISEDEQRYHDRQLRAEDIIQGARRKGLKPSDIMVGRTIVAGVQQPKITRLQSRLTGSTQVSDKWDQIRYFYPEGPEDGFISGVEWYSDIIYALMVALSEGRMIDHFFEHNLITPPPEYITDPTDKKNYMLNESTHGLMQVLWRYLKPKVLEVIQDRGANPSTYNYENLQLAPDQTLGAELLKLSHEFKNSTDPKDLERLQRVEAALNALRKWTTFIEGGRSAENPTGVDTARPTSSVELSTALQIFQGANDLLTKPEGIVELATVLSELDTVSLIPETIDQEGEVDNEAVTSIIQQLNNAVNENWVNALNYAPIIRLRDLGQDGLSRKLLERMSITLSEIAKAAPALGLQISEGGLSEMTLAQVSKMKQRFRTLTAALHPDALNQSDILNDPQFLRLVDQHRPIIDALRELFNQLYSEKKQENT
ncbi:hypothetical protein H6763_01090 [Candidatus Nomurabacteria bacterium]|uniref:Uncharacterized protein n=1 Tax=Candidatus Dojkabacteria bacterium TaxID=2099670 RepID=A0A955I8R0_9BACT|nr:hypothetical protein [Candidatus Dojkabacteria bacterium]MCB9790009.1 hypothetical protein [Candidatus Nomurabacteria bacterium]MCB9803404.1 hypothetical protein [Candidatus Nomurabacteria bacterium]